MAHLEPLNYDEILDSDIRSTIKNYEQLPPTIVGKSIYAIKPSRAL